MSFDDDDDDDNDDEHFETALEAARRARRELKRKMFTAENRNDYERRKIDDFEDEFSSEEEEEEEEEEEMIIIENKNNKEGRRKWASAFDAFDDGKRPKTPPFPLPRAFAKPEFNRGQFDDDDDSDYDVIMKTGTKGYVEQRREKRGPSEKEEEDGDTNTATTTIPRMQRQHLSSSSSSSKTLLLNNIETLAQKLRDCEIKNERALADAERESENAAKKNRENAQLREKMRKMEDSVKEMQKVCAIDRRKRVEFEDSASEAKAKSEQMKLDVRQAIALLREKETELEKFAKMAKDAEKKKNEAREHALALRANSRKLERENERLQKEMREIEERMEQIATMNERSSSLVRKSPRRHTTISTDTKKKNLTMRRGERVHNNDVDVDEEEENRKNDEERTIIINNNYDKNQTRTALTTTSTTTIAAGSKSNKPRLDSPSWSWFRADEHDVVDAPPLVSRRNNGLSHHASPSSSNRANAQTPPPYATSTPHDDLNDDAFMKKLKSFENKITSLSSERFQLSQTLATLGSGAGKTMLQRERKALLLDRSRELDRSLRAAKQALIDFRRAPRDFIFT